MCCIKVIGTMEIQFDKDIFDNYKGEMFTLRLRTHDGEFIGQEWHRIQLKRDTVVMKFDKPNAIQ